MILMQRLVKVDGKVRTDTTYPAGFMDVIELEKTNEHFRCDMLASAATSGSCAASTDSAQGKQRILCCGQGSRQQCRDTGPSSHCDFSSSMVHASFGIVRTMLDSSAALQ